MAAKRAQQARAWMWSEIGESLTAALKAHPEVARELPRLEARVTAGEMAPAAAARQLLETFLAAPRWPS